MNSEQRQQFQNVVEHVCSNWTALQLAIEHSMAGPNSRQIGQQLMNHVAEMCCTHSNVCAENIEDTLLDVLEDEFYTECEDGSPKEVSLVLFNFLKLLKEGKNDEFQAEVQKLPTRAVSSCQRVNRNRDVEASQQSDSSDEMEVEAERSEPESDGQWTTIKRKRRK